MKELLAPEERTITLKQHQQILYEIRCRVAVAAMMEDQDPGDICSDLDCIVEWIDGLRGKA